MSVEIDWNNQENQITKSYRMNDNEVSDCVVALTKAREIYTKEKEIPERIELSTYDGQVLHTIITKGGKPLTVTVKCDNKTSNKGNLKTIMTVTGFFFIGILIVRYFYY